MFSIAGKLENGRLGNLRGLFIALDSYTLQVNCTYTFKTSVHMSHAIKGTNRLNQQDFAYSCVKAGCCARVLFRRF